LIDKFGVEPRNYIEPK